MSFLDTLERSVTAEETGFSHWAWFALVSPDVDLAAQCRDWVLDDEAQVHGVPLWPFCRRCGWRRGEHQRPCERCGRSVHPLDLHEALRPDGYEAEVCGACCTECYPPALGSGSG